MATLRRIYVYLVVIVTLEIWVWDLVGLLYRALQNRLWRSPEQLALPLAGFLIALPVFVLHWHWAQRDAAADPEERASGVRAVALYVLLALTWGVVFHAVMVLVARGLEAVFAIEANTLFPRLTWERGLALLLPHGVLGWYFLTIVRRDEQPLCPQAHCLARRWYRWLWLSYSLVWVLLGAQKLLEVIFPPERSVTLVVTPLLVEALQGSVLVLGGLIIWGYWGRRWWHETLHDPQERGAGLVAAFLIVWALSGLSVSLAVAGMALNGVLLHLLGENEPLYRLVRLLITVGLPWMTVWIAAQKGLAQLIAAWDEARQAKIHRLVLSILAAAGLLLLSSGVGALVHFVLTVLWGDVVVSYRPLASGITLFVLGGMLWPMPWRALQREAMADTAARASLIRRGYLYVILFFAILAVIGFATMSAYQVLVAFLGGVPDGQRFRFALVMTLWSGSVLAYHARWLRLDWAAVRSQSQQQTADFRVLALGQESAAWLADLEDRMALPVTVLAPAEATPPEARFEAVVCSETTLLTLPPAWQAWLAAFEGARLIVFGHTPGHWFWLDGRQTKPTHLREALEALSQGRQPRSAGAPGPLWTALAYLGIFSLISWLFGLLVPLLMGLASFFQ